MNLRTLLIFCFLCWVPSLFGQSPLKATNLWLTTPPVQSTASNVARFLTFSTAGVGETVTPTKLWDAVVLTGTVDSTDLVDGTTIGRSMFTLVNPSAITFPRFNADNTTTARTAAELKTDLSLNNVDNTSDANKPVSTAQQTALNLKANAAAPALTGDGTAVNLKVSGMVSFAAPTVVSGTTIAITTPVAFVSNTNVIQTITVPSQFTGGGQITIIPTGAFTTNTSGNIALGTTAVVNKALILTWDSVTAKWYPSY